VCDLKDANIHAHRGVAIREFSLKPGHGSADYLFYLDGRAAGVIEAKKSGSTLTGVEIQSKKYTLGLPDSLPAWHRPLPFCYESTGIETKFTNGLEPDPRSRNVFSLHRPETLAAWLNTDAAPKFLAADGKMAHPISATVRAQLCQMPPLAEQGLWSAQVKAIRNLEKSLAENRPRALIQMATGSGKTFTAINFIYRSRAYSHRAKRF
jgi:type I restriction enzyme R subunit